MALCNARGNGSHPYFRDQFYTYPCIGIGVLKIEYQLCKVFY